MQIGAAEGVFFHADKMQAGRWSCLLFEQAPGAEKIQTGAEAGFANAQEAMFRKFGKALRQVIATEKNMLRFGNPGGSGKVHITEGA